MALSLQIQWLLILALPVASIAWVVTHEEIFREPREYCIKCSKEGQSIFKRKFFYLFTCEYCFSHYITLLVIIFTRYKLLMINWFGYVIGFFCIVWVANIYMNLFLLLRSLIKKIQLHNDTEEEKQQSKCTQ
jgi:hypothetical protein